MADLGPSKGRCFWFSGPAGAGVRQALPRIRDRLHQTGRRVEIVSLDDKLWSLYQETRGPFKAEPGAFKALLDEAPPYVQDLWRQSSAVCIPEIHRTLESGADVFLTFHAVYHTDKFGDFYSPVDGEILRQLPPPDKFLTLIDDIGDVAHRLREEGQVFSTRARVGLPSVREAIRDLLTILEWRAMEFTVSRLLGTFVGATPFLLAVKHPSATATRILLGNGVPSYVSHSISDSRRQVQESGSWPGFMTEVQLFTDALSVIALLDGAAVKAIDGAVTSPPAGT